MGVAIGGEQVEEFCPGKQWSQAVKESIHPILKLNTFCPRRETLFRRWWPECPPELMILAGFRHLGCHRNLCRFDRTTNLCPRNCLQHLQLWALMWVLESLSFKRLKRPQYQGWESQQWVIQGQEGEWREGSTASPETLSYFWPQCRQCPAWWVSWHHQTSWQFEVELSSRGKYLPTRRGGLSPQFWQKTWNKGFF